MCIRDSQEGAATVLLDHRVAQRGAVHLFVAKALAAQVHGDALGPGVGRRDEAPGRDRAQVVGRRGHALAQQDAAAVAAGVAVLPAARVLRRVLLDHGAVEDEAAGAQHDTPRRTHQARARHCLFQRLSLIHI